MAFQGRKDVKPRARLPRSKSTSHMLDVTWRSLGPGEDVTENAAHERTNSIRELARFLRTTGPPSHRPTSPEDCLGFLGSKADGRWSMQSLKRNRRLKSRTQSSQLQLPNGAVPETTVDGHSHIALYTPVKNKHHGPWFRSQYPVFSSTTSQAGSSVQQEWPERTTSKQACSPVMKEGVLATSQEGHGRLGSAPSQRPPGNTSNVVGSSSTMSSSEPIQGRTSQLLQDPSVSRSLENRMPREAQSRTESQTTAKPEGLECSGPLVKISKEDLSSSVPSSVPGPISVESLGASSKPGDVIVRSTLTVPSKDPLLPESPGFPNMLAALTFPSPPRSSRSPSPTNSTVFPVPHQPSVVLPGPLVRPRISSRRACTSLSVPTVSLNEVIMEPKRPALRHVRSEYPSFTPNTLVTDIANISEPNDTQAARLYLHDSNVGARHQAASPASVASSTTNTWLQESVSSNFDDDTSSYRQSLTSDYTVSTSLCWQSATTADSYRQSTRSDATEINAPAAASTVRSSKGDTASVNITQPFTYPLSATDKIADLPLQSSSHIDRSVTEGKTEAVARQPIGSAAERGAHGIADIHPVSSTAPIQRELRTRLESIGERQIARKNKVHECKMRDIDISRSGRTTAYLEAQAFESLDSPVLGWFPENALELRKSSLQGPSPLAQDWHISPTPSVAMDEMTTLEKRSTCGSLTDKHSECSKHSRVLSGHWTMSPIMTTNIAPNYMDSPPVGRLTISPIMVVANLESRPGCPTLRLSHLPKAEPIPHLPPRSALRPKTLKLGPLPRQKSYSITIAKNPSTGAIERTTSANYRLNRHSLANMPTPPLSPEPGHSPARMSLPPKSKSPENPQIPVGQTLDLREDWLLAHPGKQEQHGSRWRSAALKERVQREKLEKEKEISDIVARTVGPSQKEKYDGELLGQHLENHTTQSIERRLQRLERNSDAWLRAMKPFLENMAKTLETMRQDGMGGCLTMNEFNIDMEAEARRFSCYNQQSQQSEKLGLSGPAGQIGHRSARKGPEPLQGKEEKASTIARLHQKLGPQTDAAEKNEAGNTTTDAGEKTSSPTGRSLAESIPRSLQEHELEAQAAIKRQLQQQEAMMSNLLNRWGLPSPRLQGSSNTTASIDAKPNLLAASLSEAHAPWKETCGDTSEAADIDPLIVELRRVPWPRRLDHNPDDDTSCGDGGNAEADSDCRCKHAP